MIVTYDGNGNTGGTVPIDPTVYLEDDTVIVLDKGDLIKTDSIFLYWNTSSDDSGTSYFPADTFLMGIEDVYLYAIWSEVHVGGLIGYTPSETIVATKSYWDAQISGVTGSVGGGEPKTTDEMKIKGFSGVYENWDYDNVWYQNEP